jgi:hypothetical protein
MCYSVTATLWKDSGAHVKTTLSPVKKYSQENSVTDWLILRRIWDSHSSGYNASCSPLNVNRRCEGTRLLRLLWLWFLPASRWFLLWRILRSWIWKEHVPPKRRLTTSRAALLWVCLLSASRSFLAWFILRPWRWSRHVPPKCLLTLTDHTALYPTDTLCGQNGEFWYVKECGTYTNH